MKKLTNIPPEKVFYFNSKYAYFNQNGKVYRGKRRITKRLREFSLYDIEPVKYFRASNTVRSVEALKARGIPVIAHRDIESLAYGKGRR